MNRLIMPSNKNRLTKHSGGHFGRPFLLKRGGIEVELRRLTEAAKVSNSSKRILKQIGQDINLPPCSVKFGTRRIFRHRGASTHLQDWHTQ